MLITSHPELIEQAESMDMFAAARFLKRQGVTPEDAEVIARSLGGAEAVDVASSLGMPVGRVLSINAAIRKARAEAFR